MRRPSGSLLSCTSNNEPIFAHYNRTNGMGGKALHKINRKGNKPQKSCVHHQWQPPVLVFLHDREMATYYHLPYIFPDNRMNDCLPWRTHDRGLVTCWFHCQQWCASALSRHTRSLKLSSNHTHYLIWSGQLLKKMRNTITFFPDHYIVFVVGVVCVA